MLDEPVQVPEELVKLHKDIYLTADMSFVNSIPFFITLLSKIWFTAVNHIVNRKVGIIFKAFREIYTYYVKRGFHITTPHAYGEFPPPQARGTRFNLTSANEHAPEIEHWIRVVKERTRAVSHILYFNHTPKLISIYNVFKVVMMLNYFPVKGEVSAILNPNTTMSNETLHYKQHLGLNIGHYSQVHEHEEPRSSQLPRTKGAIWLGPSGNKQGSLLCMSLNSERKFSRRSWDTILMPETVINCVNEIAYNEKKKSLCRPHRSSYCRHQDHRSG